MVQQEIYDVALSFAGEDRALAKAVAHHLEGLGVSVFYDEFLQSHLWGKDLYTYLADVYMKRARYCVMFLSQHYAKKPWPRHEMKAAQAKALEMLSEYILPVRLDDAEIPGILPTTAYISAKSFHAEQIAEFIREKLTNPAKKIGILDKSEMVWDWGDWLPFANEFISQNPVKASEFESLMAKAGLELRTFSSRGVALVHFEVAEQCCELLGGRLPSRESLEYLASLTPPVLRAGKIDGWCSLEWTRSVVSDADRRYVIQTTMGDNGNFTYFETVGGTTGPKGARLSFRVAVLQPPRSMKRTSDLRAAAIVRKTKQK